MGEPAGETADRAEERGEDRRTDAHERRADDRRGRSEARRRPREGGARDRRGDASEGRERRLELTERGKILEKELTDRQSQRFARAYRETGADSVEGFRKVLLGLLDPAERAVVDKQVRGGR